MGTYIIDEILKYNPESLHITGMSLYSEKNINSHYLKGYLPSICEINKLNRSRIQHHSQNKQNNIIKKLIISGKISADDYILKTLGID